MKYKVMITVNEDGKNKVFNQEIEAENLRELAEKYKLIEDLNKHLKHNDMMIAKEILTNKPQLIPAIKTIIDETENKSELQIMASAPKYVSRIIKILK